jgi:hypothetical protein
MDQRNVTQLHLLQYVPDNYSRPKLWTYRFALPDDSRVPVYEPIVVDVFLKKVVPVFYKAQPEVSLDVDDNVNPCITMQLVDMFIKDDKPFDLLIMTNRNHDLSYDTYYLHRLFGYFRENLMETERPMQAA